MKEKNKDKKEISNKKAIIAIFILMILLIVLGVVYANIFKQEDDECQNTKNTNRTVEIKTDKNGTIIDVKGAVDYKPIIYIYPEQEQNVKVTLGSSDKLLVSYPEYKSYWSVFAKNDGTLFDNKTGRELYSLYYES